MALTILAVLGLVGTWMLQRSSQVTNQLVNHSSPALLASVRMEAALVNQQTGILGYGLTGKTSYLAVYARGLDEEQSSTAALRVAIAGDADAERQLADVLTAAAAWHRLATPVAAAAPAEAGPLAKRTATAAQTAFVGLRATAATQQQHLQAEQTNAESDLRRVSDVRDIVFGAIAVLIAVLAVLVFEGLRRGITAPLGRLAADSAQVASGDFDHPIVGTGPADLRQLADGVDAMRRRLRDEIALLDHARIRLDEQAAELRRSNAELEQFAYVASHDLQEPLRKVASFCQLLQRRYGDQLDERAQQYIAFAVDGATRMQTLINDLLAFSRVGRLNVKNVDVDLEQVLATTLNTLSLTVVEAGAHVTHDPLPTVHGDPTQLGMLMQNLLSNSLKFRAPDRQPRVHVEAVRDGDWWRFAVADNGIGIDPEYADRVFTIFQRLHTRAAYPGTGIGLALCRKIVELHGGTIDVDREYGPGARLVFTLPATPDAPPEDGAEADA